MKTQTIDDQINKLTIKLLAKRALVKKQKMERTISTIMMIAALAMPLITIPVGYSVVGEDILLMGLIITSVAICCAVAMIQLIQQNNNVIRRTEDAIRSIKGELKFFRGMSK